MKILPWLAAIRKQRDAGVDQGPVAMDYNVSMLLQTVFVFFRSFLSCLHTQLFSRVPLSHQKYLGKQNVCFQRGVVLDISGVRGDLPNGEFLM